MSDIITKNVDTGKEINFYLVSGLRLVGKIVDFETDVDGKLTWVAISTPNKNERMEILGHAIATIVDPQAH